MVNAQQVTIDSLKQALTEKNDSNDCKTYQRLSFAYLDTDLDSARIFAQKALQLAIALERPNSQVTSLNAIGLTYFYQGLFQRAIVEWQKAKKLAHSISFTEQYFSLMMRIGAAQSRLGYNDSARFTFMEAKEAALARNDSTNVISCITNIAVEDFNQGFHDKAIPNYLEILSWYNRNYTTEKAQKMADIAINIGSSFVELKDYKRAMKYAKIGKFYADSSTYFKGIFGSNMLIGIIYNFTEKYDSALHFYNKATTDLKRAPSPYHEMQLLTNKAQNFANQLILDSAFAYYKQALKLSYKLKTPANKCIILIGMGEAYINNNNLDSALHYTQLGFYLANSNHFFTHKKNAYKLLSLVYERKGNTDSAYFHLSKHMALKDSLVSLETIQRLNFIESFNEKKLQKAKLKRAEEKSRITTEKLNIKEHQNRNLILFSMLVLLILGALIAILFILFSTRNKLKQTNKNLINEKENLQQRTSQLDAANKTLKETQAQLIQNEKLASIGQLTAGIAHEINNPINYVKAGIDSLKLELNDIKSLLNKDKHSEQVSKNASIEEIIKEIDLITNSITKGANRTAEIVRGLRIYARTDKGNLSKVDLHTSIDNCLLLLHSSYKDRISIVKDFADNAIIEGYREKLDQVLMNLLSNAVQAIEQTGNIVIKTEQLDNEIKLSITDSGVGIEQGTMSKIFDPFFTTKEIGKGTGLGLSISLEIVKEHHGTLKAESKPGQTTFTLVLPLEQLKG
ncbi:MAG: GHKL domain-containing protein [Bacteroidetes bacterium]|nr:GHKL domain-containing protein [Bacteroidota bacterium]